MKRETGLEPATLGLGSRDDSGSCGSTVRTSLRERQSGAPVGSSASSAAASRGISDPFQGNERAEAGADLGEGGLPQGPPRLRSTPRAASAR
jgi:hypothetical protein